MLPFDRPVNYILSFVWLHVSVMYHRQHGSADLL